MCVLRSTVNIGKAYFIFYYPGHFPIQLHNSGTLKKTTEFYIKKSLTLSNSLMKIGLMLLPLVMSSVWLFPITTTHVLSVSADFTLDARSTVEQNDIPLKS